MPPPTSSVGISRERFNQGPRNFTHSSQTIGLTNLLDMASLAASSRLQNAIKYCAKVPKANSAGQRVKQFSHCLTYSITKFCRDIHVDIVLSRTGYDVTSYFRSAVIDGFIYIKTKASSYISTEEYRRRFRIKRRGVSPSPTFWWASCFSIVLPALSWLSVLAPVC